MTRHILDREKGTTFVLALDLSLNGPGASVLALNYDRVGAVTPTSVTIAAVSHLRTNTRTNRGSRMDEIVRWARDLDNRYPTMERVYAKEDAPPSPVTGAILNRVHGAVEAGFAPRDWVDIPQGTVKSIVVGRGGSDVEKGDVEAAVREHLRLDPAFPFANSDESDAVAVGLAYLTLAGALPTGSQYDGLRRNLGAWLTSGGAKERAKRAKFADGVRKTWQSERNGEAKKTRGARVA